MTSLSSSSLFFSILLLTLHLTASNDREELEQDKKALLDFMDKVKQHPRINWYDKPEPDTCKWTGVTCDPGIGRVINLRLPGQGLKGQIPSGTLGKLSSLTVLSLRYNRLSGPIPDDFAELRSLKYVYLYNNSFSGPLFVVTNWTNLIQLDVSNNSFTGPIPDDIDNLEKLEQLKLNNNQLKGWLPLNVSSNIKPDNFSVSNNYLIGNIPESLVKLNYSPAAFSGNDYLCGVPLSRLCNETLQRPPSPSKLSASASIKKKKNKLSTGVIIAIAIGSTWILLILLICLGKTWKKKSAAGAGRGFGGGGEAGTSSSKDGAKLVFFEGGGYSFDLEDLFRASAEVLGKGSVGKSYKTVLMDDITVVVKRLKDVDVSKETFYGVMEGLGKMKNENVVPIRAYYYSKFQQLIVCDYFPTGSLSPLLHGSRGSGCTPLDWDHRFRIALSAAKGVAYLHVTGKVVHGNIKSSNILLQDSNKDACVSDFGLNTLFGGSSSPNTRVTGYLAPEVLKTQEVTFKSDVYSFGILLLELLSGKAPNHASLREKRTDLPSWVKSVKGEEWTVQEKWTTEVFDAQLMMYPNIGEMVQLLRIAMECVSIEPDQRPAMQEVVWKMEDMNRAKTDDGMGQSSDDPSKGSDGHTPPNGVEEFTHYRHTINLNILHENRVENYIS